MLSMMCSNLGMGMAIRRKMKMNWMNWMIPMPPTAKCYKISLHFHCHPPTTPPLGGLELLLLLLSHLVRLLNPLALHPFLL
jgi:hypothetical protein